MFLRSILPSTLSRLIRTSSSASNLVHYYNHRSIFAGGTLHSVHVTSKDRLVDLLYFVTKKNELISRTGQTEKHRNLQILSREQLRRSRGSSTLNLLWTRLITRPKITLIHGHNGRRSSWHPKKVPQRRWQLDVHAPIAEDRWIAEDLFAFRSTKVCTAVSAEYCRICNFFSFWYKRF